MERGRAGLAATGGEGGPALELLFAADCGREAILDIVARIGPALEAVEHIDSRLRRQRPPRGDPLAEMGDKEDPRARGPKRRRRLGDPDPVSGGLDDGAATPGRGPARKIAPVVRQRGEVDRETPRRADRGRDGNHLSIFSITAIVGVSNPGCVSTSRRAKLQRSNSRSFSGSSSRVLSVIPPAPRRLASVSQAAINERANPRPRALGATDTRAIWSASSFGLHKTAAMSPASSKTPIPPPAAILAAIDGPVSRRADDAGLVGRFWAAKAVRMSSAAPPASAFVNGRRTSWGAASASLALGSRISIRACIRPPQGRKASAPH